MRTSINRYCAAIGADSLLVQGAGGNVSWKDGTTLWIKASGTWLADAASKDIFVPVDLGHLHKAILSEDFGVTPRLTEDSLLRPSIETLLHALMPHTVVIHLHAIEVLARLVRPDFERELASALVGSISWASVGYEKPGSELARAVHGALLHMPDANVIFLQNHGLVIGGSDTADVDATLKYLIDRLRISPRSAVNSQVPDVSIELAGQTAYAPVQDKHIQQLAIDMALFERLETDWVLYPDHVVFLGAKANVYVNVDSMKRILALSTNLPELVFVKGFGVYVQPGFSVAKIAQLRCYYDVLTRQKPGTKLGSLKLEQIAELLNWDAERYRMHVAK